MNINISRCFHDRAQHISLWATQSSISHWLTDDLLVTASPSEAGGSWSLAGGSRVGMEVWEEHPVPGWAGGRDRLIGKNEEQRNLLTGRQVAYFFIVILSLPVFFTVEYPLETSTAGRTRKHHIKRAQAGFQSPKLMWGISNTHLVIGLPQQQNKFVENFYQIKPKLAISLLGGKTFLT